MYGINWKKSICYLSNLDGKLILSEKLINKCGFPVSQYLFIKHSSLVSRWIYREHYIMGEDVTARSKQEGVQLAEQTTH